MRDIVAFDDQPAILRCSGDEDRVTQGRRRRALSRAQRAERDVVVDMTELRFADASLMVDLAVVARKLRQRGRKLLLRGAAPHIRAVIELVGLSSQPGVRFA